MAAAALTAFSIPAFADALQSDLSTSLGGKQAEITLAAPVVGNSAQTQAVDLWVNGSGDDSWTVTGSSTADSDVSAAMAGVSVSNDGTHHSGTISWTAPAAQTSDANYDVVLAFSGSGGDQTLQTTGSIVTIHFTVIGTGSGPVDTTAPEISYVLDPATPDGDNGWYTVPVTLTWTVSEPDSPGSLVKTGCVDQNITADQTEVTYSCSASSDGGSADLVQVSIKKDGTAPDVSLVGGPADGESYYFGFVPDEPTCTASDATSGLADECAVSGYGTTVGHQTVTASATDNAGNSNSDTAEYDVLAWTLSGFYAPVDLHGVLNTVKGGSTVPLKFEIFAGDTEITDVDAIASFTTTKVACDGSAPSDTVEITSTGGTSLRYDATGGQFIQNWKTPTGKGQCYSATMTTDDGSSISALFQIK